LSTWAFFLQQQRATPQHQQQQQQARMWDHMKDAEKCLIELAGDDGAELKSELRYVGGCMSGFCVAIVAGACLYTC
jgi:hypothetical protein